MCGSMVDMQSPAAEIRRGKKIERKIVTIKGKNITACLFHRAAITTQDDDSHSTGSVDCTVIK